MALALAVGFWFFRAPFTLEAPGSFSLHAGELKTLGIHYTRLPPEELVEISLTGLPPHVIAKAIPAGDDQQGVNITAEPDAAPGSQEITIHATLGSYQQDTSFTLTIEAPAYYLPAGWERAEGNRLEADGKVYYQRINVLRDDQRVAFVFVPRDTARRNSPNAFYMMETKVWLGLYRRFAARQKGVNNQWEKLAVNHNDQFPIMGVVWEDARKFAQWLAGSDRGDLPTLDQWDYAAGRFLPTASRGRGPFLEGANEPAFAPIAINQKEPTAVDKPTRDVSFFHIRHMAGNGREWTRDAEGIDKKFISLRGCSYEADRPLLFEDFNESEKSRLGIWPKDQPKKTIGFRVVFEP
jgi:hypothetical protein